MFDRTRYIGNICVRIQNYFFFQTSTLEPISILGLFGTFNVILFIQKSLLSILIQLFRERLSKKVHATIPKGIVGGFEFTVLQRNLKELARKAMKMCLRVLTESNKSRFDSYSRQEQCIDYIPYYLSGLSRADNLSRNSCICVPSVHV